MRQPLTPSLEAISDERKSATKEASKLEAEILRTVIRHAQENNTPTTIIMLALLNCATHWANRQVNVGVTQKLYADLNQELSRH